MTSPTRRSLKLCRQLGLYAQVVERWNPHARRRVDLFGCIDVVAVGRGAILGVQATTAANVGARWAKAVERQELRSWLCAGARFEVWGWAKRGGRWSVKRYVAVLREATAGEATVGVHVLSPETPRYLVLCYGDAG